MKHSPQSRLRAFVVSIGSNLAAEARLLGCTRQSLTNIANGHTLPRRALANAIERRTAGWDGGPIRAAEWDGPVGAPLRKNGRRPARPSSRIPPVNEGAP
jgi:hypothetical protein